MSGVEQRQNSSKAPEEAVAEAFDPYHQWLGIPAAEQPPDHYRLLAIPHFEDSPAVIENAANQRMAHLRTFQGGKYSALSQRLLNEVATAKIRLLNAEKKLAYDQLLRERLAPASRQVNLVQASALDPGLAEVLESEMTSAARISAKPRRKAPQSVPVPMIAAAATLVAAGLLGLWWLFVWENKQASPVIAKGADSAKDSGPSKVAEPATGVRPDKDRSAKSVENAKPASVAVAREASADAHGGGAGVIAGPKPAAVNSVATNSEKPSIAAPLSGKIAAAEPPARDSPQPEVSVPEASPLSQPTPAAPAKLPLPSAEEQKRLMTEIDEVYKPGDAKDEAAKASLARKLLEDGRKNESNRSEQFVMLRRAGEMARDAGEADLMLEAVDAIAAAGFDIRPYQVKARLMKQLIAQGPSGGASQISTRTASCVKFAVEAAGSGATAEAAEVLDAAGKSLARLVVTTQAAKRVAKAAAARARDSAEKAAQQKKADAADADLEAIRSAQASISDCNKALQRALREREEIQSARLRLKTAPDDPAANLAVGRWECFQQGHWDEGLKLLARGSDPDLKSLSATELGSKPANTEERIARGDAWWNLAEKAAGKAHLAMRRRAGQWYQEALPDLATGLAKARVEKRLADIAAEPAIEPGDIPGRPAGTRPPLAVAPFDEPAAKQYQERWAKYLHVPVVLSNSIGMKLVLIPPGEYMMGSPKELIDEILRTPGLPDWYHEHLPGEMPQHKVRITRPFWLGLTAVTQQEYQHVMGVNPSKFQGDAQRPAEQISWDQAVDFCRRLSELPGEKAARRAYALPTEAQWEYACRAGTTGRWISGDGPGLEELAWFKNNSGDITHPVRTKKANAWGLYDMHGNVWQWCQDYFDVGYYAVSPADDPPGPATGTYRVYRGGSWANNGGNVRSAYRYRDNAIGRYPDLGLRVAAAMPGKSGK
jgi:formylglycine-generating enzyme required for sulfatase activity